MEQNTTERLKEFANLVKEMREAQNNYFSAIRQKLYQTANGFLKQSKQLEREVDHATSQIIAGVEQTKLFV